MKSILAGAWPPLRPLPVFKYETAEYRATIDFDKKRGEWVCRKISLPSNDVQELRGGLAEITLALPHGEAERLVEVPEQQEPEFEKETNRRLQAIREWKEKYANGARYFELRGFLSESQRSEMDDSLRLSLTARQLQFSPKNVANVFDDLSVAGGRFAALMEFANRKKENPGTDSEAQSEAGVPEAECAIDMVNHEEQPLGISSPEFVAVLNNDGAINSEALVPDQEDAERCTASESGADEFPVVSIKDVFPEQEQGPLTERMAHVASRHFEISEIVDADSPLLDSRSLVENPHPGERHSVAFTDFAAQAASGQSFENGIEGAGRIEGSSRFPVLKISAFSVNVFAILLLFAVTAFTVGLTVGRGPLSKRLREAPKSLLATEAKPPTHPEEADESTPRTPPSPVASSDTPMGTKKLGDATPPDEKLKENTGGTEGSENSAEVHPMKPNSSPTTDSDASPTTEPKPTAKTEVNSEPRGAMGPIVRSVAPRVNPKVAHSRKVVGPRRSGPRRHVPYRLTSAIGAAPQLPRSSTVLVTAPSEGSPPFRVNFPPKAIAATSSLAMTSQLSVLVPAESGPAVGHVTARLEAGDLVSFVWPHYAGADRYGMAETIRVRATVGQVGQVEEVKFLSGSLSLLPATREAIRQWRYKPTLLDEKPVQAQQDVTIEFRPERYSSRLLAQHSSHN